jgi:O-antigen/teichoic acid export membrane protein
VVSRAAGAGSLLVEPGRGRTDPDTAARAQRVDLALAIARQVVSAAANLLVVPLVARTLGAEALASWAVLGTASFLLGVADLGTSVTVQRAAMSGQHGGGARAARLSMTVVVSVALALAIAMRSELVLPGVAPELARDVRAATLPVLGAGLAAALLGPLRGLLLAHGDLRGLASSRVLSALAQLVLTGAGFLWHRTLVVPAGALLASQVLELVLVARAARVVEPALRFAPTATSWAELRAFVREGAAALVINLAVLASIRLDVVILAHTSPLTAVAGYAVASRAVDQSLSVAKQVSAALASRLGRAEERAAAVYTGTGVLGSLAGAGLAALALAGQPLLVAWTGEVAREPACAVALLVLGAAAVLTAVTEMPAAAVTLADTSAWRAVAPFVAAAVLNVGASVLLAPRLGPVGVALGTVIGNGAALAWLWVRARTLLRWSWAAVARAVAPAVAACALSAGLVLGVRSSVPEGATAALLLASLVTGVGTAVGLLVSRALAPAH